MDNPRRCIHQHYQRSPASSLGGPKELDSPGNSRVVISCAGRGRSSVGSPRETSCPGVLHRPPVLTCRRCLCPVTGINQVCRGKGESPPMSYTDPGLRGPGTRHRCTMRNQPHPSAWKKGGDEATEAPIWDRLVSLSFAPAIPAPVHIFF